MAECPDPAAGAAGCNFPSRRLVEENESRSVGRWPLDIQQRVLQGDRGSLMDRIPGYRGYKEKELRREADKLLRDRVADAVAGEVRQLNALKLDLTNRGQLMLLPEFERITLKLQRFADQVRTASY